MEMAVAGGGAGGKDEEAQGGEMVAVASTTGRRLMDFIPIYIPTVEEGLLEDAPRERRLLDFLKARPSRDWFVHLGFVAGRIPSFSSSIRPRITGQEGDGGVVSPSDPPTGGGRRFRVLFVRKINWGGMARYAKNWVKKPKHMALLVWLAAVAAGLVLMLLVASGALNHSIPKSSRRKRWLEIDNQILNALFTIMCLYEHPKLVHHLVLLVRWSAKDVAELRRLYSRKGVARRGERGHMAFVLSLLHITCLSQYALCGLYWGYNRHNRPDVGENLCLAVGVAAPVVAGVYVVYGPLGRKVAAPQADGDQAAPHAAPDTRQAEKLAAQNRRVVVTRPEWVGGLFDCCDDSAVAYLSFFCTFCVFGWNMERLGFGNMYVHIVTFLLLVVSPGWVFTVAALNIDDWGMRLAVQISGVVLCVFGLLYGGFWIDLSMDRIRVGSMVIRIRIRIQKIWIRPGSEIMVQYRIGFGSSPDRFRITFLFPKIPCPRRPPTPSLLLLLQIHVLPANPCPLLGPPLRLSPLFAAMRTPRRQHPHPAAR